MEHSLVFSRRKPAANRRFALGSADLDAGFLASFGFRISGLPSRNIRRRRLKVDDRFVGLGVAEFFAGESFHRFGVAAQCVKFRLELPGRLALLFQFGVQRVNPPTHLLVLVDERQVGHADEQ